MINIAIAEDHQVMIDGMTALLESFCEFKVVLTANNGKIIIDKLHNFQESNVSVDIILMDINMPELDGIQASKIVKEKFPAIKILIITMFDDIKLIRETLKAGVDGYVLKAVGFDELEYTIKTIMSGSTYFCKHVTDKILGTSKKKDYLDFE